MRKRLVLTLLILVTATVVLVAVGFKLFSRTEEEKSVPKVVVPQVDGQEQAQVTTSSLVADEMELKTLIPLNPDETLLGMISLDLDGDKFDDQVVAVKSSAGPNISLVVGLYNSKSKTYDRSHVIETEVSQYRNFSFTGIDLSGKHKLALVYQGVTDTGNSVLQANHFYRSSGKLYVHRIADFTGDGTIFIQQVDRYDSYQRYNSNGAPYPIWVYSTDLKSKSGADQLQTRYDWNEDEKKYTKATQVRVAGSKLAAKELAKVQDGTIKTLAGHLKGLWYKKEKNGIRYLEFDYDTREISFYKNDIQEVYAWGTSRLRRNGVYIITNNQEIENLQRRVDISLLSIDEIRIRIQDDVRMLITENTDWDGEYKKLSWNQAMEAAMGERAQAERSRFFRDEIQKQGKWFTSEGFTVEMENGKWQLNGEDISDTGLFTSFDSLNEPFFQFRSNSSDFMYFDGIYRVHWGEKVVKRKKVDDTDILVLEPYRVTPTEIFPVEGKVITLNRVVEE